MILIITDGGGGDLYCHVLTDDAMTEIKNMPTTGEDFKEAMFKFLENNKFEIQWFSIQSPVIEHINPPLKNIQTIIFLT